MDDDAGEVDNAGEVNGVPCCTECGRPLDQVETMGELELLLSIRLGLLKDLARNLTNGTATHQEKAIAKSILRDNRMGLDQRPPAASHEDGDDEPAVDDGPSVPTNQRVPKYFPDSRG